MIFDYADMKLLSSRNYSPNGKFHALFTRSTHHIDAKSAGIPEVAQQRIAQGNSVDVLEELLSLCVYRRCWVPEAAKESVYCCWSKPIGCLQL